MDIPECALVGILDADREGFLRSKTSLIQTIGRAARNVEGKVILYADIVTDSIKQALEETDRRRKKQIKWNQENNITPKSINKKILDLLGKIKVKEDKVLDKDTSNSNFKGHNLKKLLIALKKEMYEEAENLNFEKAAAIRDEISKLEKEELNL